MNGTKGHLAVFTCLVAAVSLGVFAWAFGVRQDAAGSVKCLLHYHIVDTVLETHVGHELHCVGFTRTGWTGLDSNGVRVTGTVCVSNWYAPSETLIVQP